MPKTDDKQKGMDSHPLKTCQSDTAKKHQIPSDFFIASILAAALASASA